MTDRREYQREWVRRKRRAMGVKPRGDVSPCGTTAAYLRHRRHGEEACDACRRAWADYHRARRGARKGNG